MSCVCARSEASQQARRNDEANVRGRCQLGQQHRSADRIERRQRTLAAQVLKQHAAVVAPAVAVEGWAARGLHAVRVDDVLPCRQQPVDQIRAPRHIDIDKVSDEEIQDIVLTANLTPRKCLGFKTPFQAILKELGKDVQIRFS